MPEEDWTHLNQFLDERFKKVEARMVEIAATCTREVERLATIVNDLMTRVAVAEAEIEDHETYIREDGGRHGS